MGLVRAFFSDPAGNVVVWQRPNAAIIAWAGASLAAFLVPSSGVEDILRLLATVMLFLWALAELISGVNSFRRSLGALVLVLATLSY